MRRVALLVGAVVLAASPALAAETLPGPIPATVVRVIDGDTAVVQAHIWLGSRSRSRSASPGSNAPELRGQ